MANNIVIGQNIVHAKQTINIASTGVNALNVLIIYCMDPDTSFSYIPGRTINGITQFIEGKSYLLKALQEMDLSEYLMPPFSAGTNGIVTEDGFEIIPE